MATAIKIPYGNGGGGKGVEFLDSRVEIDSTNWSANPNSDGYYTYTFFITENNKKQRICTNEIPVYSLTGANDSTLYTSAQEAAYNLIDDTDNTDVQIVESGNSYIATQFTLLAETKPTTTFYIFVKAMKYGATSGSGGGGGTTLLPKPTVSIGTYTYNGTEQSPTITGFDPSTMYISGTSASTNAGSFTFTIGLINNNTHVWYDQTTGLVSNQPLEFNWSIAKATPTLTVSSDSITLDEDHTSVAVTITTDSDGELSASSSDSTVATASISGSTLTITSPDSKHGSVTITVILAASTNYNSGSVSVSVAANFKPELVSWSSGTDEQITKMIEGYYAGNLTLNEIKSVWSTGQKRTVSLSAMSATGVSESHRAQNVEMVILDFNHDALVTPINGKTYSLITVQTRDCLRDASVSDTGGSNNTENGYMNSTNTNIGGWTSCARRTWCNSVFYNALPSYFKSLVKQVNKITNAGNTGSTNNNTSDYVFLVSECEIHGTVSHTFAGEGNQYSYFKTESNRCKLPKWSSSALSAFWWCRSPDKDTSTYFCGFLSGSGAGTTSASSKTGLAPACCL